MQQCRVDGCNKQIRARGLCVTHLNWYYHLFGKGTEVTEEVLTVLAQPREDRRSSGKRGRPSGISKDAIQQQFLKRTYETCQMSVSARLRLRRMMKGKPPRLWRG